MEKFVVDRKPANNIMILLKNQIQLSKFGDLIDCIKQFMNQVASHLVTIRKIAGFVQNGRFYRRKSGARELLANKKKGLYLGQDIFFGKGREWPGFFIMQIASSFYGGLL